MNYSVNEVPRSITRLKFFFFFRISNVTLACRECRYISRNENYVLERGRIIYNARAVFLQTKLRFRREPTVLRDISSRYIESHIEMCKKICIIFKYNYINSIYLAAGCDRYRQARSLFFDNRVILDYGTSLFVQFIQFLL